MKRSAHTLLAAGLLAAALALPGCVPAAPTAPAASTGSSAPGTEPAKAPAQWVQLGGKRYFQTGTGRVLTGWLEIGGAVYYLDPLQEGAMVTGWQTIDKGRYCFDENGVMLTGEQTLQGKIYHFDQNGRFRHGRYELGGRTRYFAADGQEILLVNPWNPIPIDYTVELVQIQGDEDGAFARSCADALQALLAACEAAGHKPCFYSGYRTQELQATYFDSWCNFLMSQGLTREEAVEAAKTEVAYPGTSEHQLGLAVDLTDFDYQTLDEKQAETATQQWLMAHCWEYGFILRYPEGSTASTGIIYEPWHYRYVGVELALELRDSGQTLEEYLQSLPMQEE